MSKTWISGVKPDNGNVIDTSMKPPEPAVTQLTGQADSPVGRSISGVIGQRSLRPSVTIRASRFLMMISQGVSLSRGGGAAGFVVTRQASP
jgi:hypothetical protein